MISLTQSHTSQTSHNKFDLSHKDHHNFAFLSVAKFLAEALQGCTQVVPVMIQSVSVSGVLVFVNSLRYLLLFRAYIFVCLIYYNSVLEGRDFVFFC